MKEILLMADRLEEMGDPLAEILRQEIKKRIVADKFKTHRLVMLHGDVKWVERIEGKGDCPECQSEGVWRRGAYFDHEKRCQKCHCVWEPLSVGDSLSLEIDIILG